MISIKSISNINYEDYDKIFAIVRNMKNKNEHIAQANVLSPSYDLLNTAKSLEKDGMWNKDTFNSVYVPRFIEELRSSEAAKKAFDYLVGMDAEGHNVALGCFCVNEDTCHRSIVGGILKGMGAKVSFEKEDNDYEKYYAVYSGEKTWDQVMEEEAQKEKEAAAPAVEEPKKQLVDEVKNEMYGSVHTHAEDMFDTGNDLKEWVKNFIRRGAKKVALTGHGSMFAYEDLKDILKKMKDKGAELPEDYQFDIIPGVEIYFNGLTKEGNEQKSKHMVLIAKNYEGYVDLCRVISESSRNSKISTANRTEDSEYLTPLVTMENLRENIRKGNVIATTACAGGVFCYDLAMNEWSLREKVDKEKKKVGGEKFFETFEKQKALVAEYQERKNSPDFKKPKAADLKKAEKAMQEGDETLWTIYKGQERIYNANQQWLAENKDAYDFAKKEIGKAEKKMNRIHEAESDLEAYIETEPERMADAKEEYQQLIDIFGEENFFFEIQNHTLPFEKMAYNRLIDFAYQVTDHPKFVASNDTHIGDYKGTDTWKNSVLKRSVERFKRFKNIEEDRGDQEEYGIKSDAELKEILLQSIEEHTDPDGVIHPAEEIIDEAIGNIPKVLEQCEVKFPKISIDGINHYPKFCDDENARFEEEVEKGVAWRFPDGLPEGYRERIDYEKEVIKSMGFAGYHLIVQDYLKYGRLLGYMRTKEEIDNAPLSIEDMEQYIKDHNIPKIGMGIGPGRGSATGSLCGYLLGITELDPLQYDLLFERFLNPSRQTMPDIDSDFKDDIREKVYEYIKTRYGDECVSKVATKSYTHGKGAVLLMQQYMTTEFEDQEKEKLSKYLEEKKDEMDPKDFLAFEKAEKADMKARVASRKADLLLIKSQISKLFDAYVKEKDISVANHPERGTKALEDMLKDGVFNEPQAEMAKRAVEVAGVPATLGMHACACLISGDPLRDVIPLAWNEKNQKMTTQCLYPQAEELGLLKMDLLNIKNLSVITRVMQETADAKLSDPKEVQKILKDPRIYDEIYSKGRTLGIFQVESPGMTKMMKDFKPSCFEDIILLVAAYRPGPLAFIPEIIAQKRHQEDPVNNKAPKKSLDIDNPILQEILAPTYGVPIYQEQVMHIFQKLAGYSLADADNVRRFMSKKKEEPLKKEKPFFIHGDPERGIRGCVAAGLTEAEAELLFDKLVEFSKYAFNKSHAAAYAQVSVFTAYQKLYYPLPFYKHTLSNEMQDGAGNENPVTKYMAEMHEMGISILPPRIGKSLADFTIEGNAIRMGYGNIKGQSYIDYNTKEGMSLMEFIWTNPEANASAINAFIKLGMFDQCWATKNPQDEINRVAGDKKLMMEWVNGTEKDAEGNSKPGHLEQIKALGEAFRKRSATYDDIQRIKGDIQYAQASGDETNDLEEDLQEKRKEIAEIREEIASLNETLQRERDEQVGVRGRERTTEEKIEDRKYETECLGFPFGVVEESKELKRSGWTYNFDMFENRKETILKEGKELTSVEYSIPAIIVSDTKKMSKNMTDYHLLQLMDQNEKILTVMYFSPDSPNLESGMFKISYNPPKNGFGESYRLQSVEPFKPNMEQSRSWMERDQNGIAHINREAMLEKDSDLGERE